VQDELEMQIQDNDEKHDFPHVEGSRGINKSRYARPSKKARRELGIKTQKDSEKQEKIQDGPNSAQPSKKVWNKLVLYAEEEDEKRDCPHTEDTEKLRAPKSTWPKNQLHYEKHDCLHIQTAEKDAKKLDLQHVKEGRGINKPKSVRFLKKTSCKLEIKTQEDAKKQDLHAEEGTDLKKKHWRPNSAQPNKKAWMKLVVHPQEEDKKRDCPHTEENTFIKKKLKGPKFALPSKKVMMRHTIAHMPRRAAL